MALALMRCIHQITHQNGHGTPASYPNKLIKIQEIMYFPRVSKKCQKMQNSVKSSKRCQKVAKSAKKVSKISKKGSLYQCSPFSSQSLKTHHSQTLRARELKFDVHPPPRITCHMSNVTCHVSLITCHVS